MRAASVWRGIPVVMLWSLRPSRRRSGSAYGLLMMGSPSLAASFWLASFPFCGIVMSAMRRPRNAVNSGAL